MGFRLQAVPSVPVPDVAAVITVDEQALGGGPGLAHSAFARGVNDGRTSTATSITATNCQSQTTCQNPTCPATMGSRQANPGRRSQGRMILQHQCHQVVHLRVWVQLVILPLPPSAPWRASASDATAPAPDASAPDAAASAPRDPLVPEASRADVCAARWFDRVGRLNPILSMHESHAPAFAWHDPVMFLVKKKSS